MTESQDETAASPLLADLTQQHKVLGLIGALPEPQRAAACREIGQAIARAYGRAIDAMHSPSLPTDVAARLDAARDEADIKALAVDYGRSGEGAAAPPGAAMGFRRFAVEWAESQGIAAEDPWHRARQDALVRSFGDPLRSDTCPFVLRLLPGRFARLSAISSGITAYRLMPGEEAVFESHTEREQEAVASLRRVPEDWIVASVSIALPGAVGRTVALDELRAQGYPAPRDPCDML